MKNLNINKYDTNKYFYSYYILFPIINCFSICSAIIIIKQNKETNILLLI